ncbi:hypothetical protein [Dyella silvatica]|uniref:hypothetical protein n=1 Tax=Dyella silvatica TaxID=2992128 RepID=UPI0022589E1F|nr:hypothetical protein [Dyella silvatica]
MKRLLAGLVLVAATAALSGCYYDPGYSYVRSSAYSGDVYYGSRSTVVYDNGYYPGYYPSYYGGYYGCCYGPVGGVWYGGSRWRGNGWNRGGYWHGGNGYRGGGGWRGSHPGGGGGGGHGSWHGVARSH